MRHLTQAHGKNLSHVQSWHVETDEAQPSDVLVVDRSFAAQFEDFRAINRVPKLQLLHVNFNAYVRQIVFLFLELKNGILNFCLRLVELLEKTLHILS